MSAGVMLSRSGVEPGVERQLVRRVGGERQAAEVAGRQDVAREVRSHRGDRGENTKRQD